MSGISKLADSEAFAPAEKIPQRRGPFSKATTASGGISDLPMELKRLNFVVLSSILLLLGEVNFQTTEA